jgi:hypothetical protein
VAARYAWIYGWVDFAALAGFQPLTTSLRRIGELVATPSRSPTNIFEAFLFPPNNMYNIVFFTACSSYSRLYEPCDFILDLLI